MKIVKNAIEMGNGAAVYVPKEYAGMELIVIVPEGINELKRRILGRLIERMHNILGVYLYGSYAREEQNKDSDVDVLVITKEKDESIKDALRDMDVRVVTIDDIKKSIENVPLLIMPILYEASVLVNPVLLDELKKSKINFRKFKWNFEDIKRVIKIIETFLEIDEKDISNSHIYSLIMRIRVCYIIECLLKKKEFSNRGVKSLLENYGLNDKDIQKAFDIYRDLRDSGKSDIRIDKEYILNILRILKYYSEKLKKKVNRYEKKKKT